MKTRNKYYNPNPTKKDDRADCVVRAMCKALDKNWDEAYIELCKLGLELKAMPNDNMTWKEYLERNGFVKHSIKVVKGSRRPTVQSFAKDHKKGTFVLNVANHIVTVVDGYYYDTWDSGEKSLYGFYEKVN